MKIIRLFATFVCSFILSFALFGVVSHANYNCGDAERLADEIYNTFGVSCYDNTVNDVISEWEENKDNFPYLFIKCEVFENNNYGGVYLCSSNPTVNNNGQYTFNNAHVIR